MIIRFSYSSSCFFLSRQAPMIIKKIFSGFLPVGQRKRGVLLEKFLALQASLYVAEWVFKNNKSKSAFI